MKRRTVLKFMSAPAVAALFGTDLWQAAAAAPSVTRAASLAARTGPPGLTEKIASFVSRTRFHDLPPQVVEKTKELIVFLLGRAFEGSSSRAMSQLDAVAPSMGQPLRGRATVIGRAYRLAPSDAAFMNCTMMRGDYGQDDLLWPAVIHAGPVTLPAALALAEVHRLSGKELITAYALAYEVMGKLGSAANPLEARPMSRGTIVYGTFGPVIAAARLLKLGEQQTTHVLGYAVNIAMGTPIMMTHYYSFLPRNGILAAQLAAAGGAAYSRTTIEGALGLYRTFFGEVPAALPKLVDTLGSDWAILNAEPKKYFGTGNNAVPIALLDRLLRDQPMQADHVRRIDAVLPYAQYDQLRRDVIAAQGPFGETSAAYSSLPYALALLLMFGPDNVDTARWYAADADPSIVNDAAVRHVMQRIFVTFEGGHESMRSARLEIALADGRHVRRESQHFEMPFPRNEWHTWLQRRGSAFLSDEQLQRLERRIADLENLGDVSTLMTAVVPAKRAMRCCL